MAEKLMSKGKEVEEFFDDMHVTAALSNCINAGFSPLYMPEIVDIKIAAGHNSRPWKVKYYTTPSIRAIGRSKQGNPVVVYVHVPNYFSIPDNIDRFREDEFPFRRRMPQEEFLKLLDKEDGENVFVADYGALRKSVSGIIHLDDALAHPQTIPFLGGETRAERYLSKYDEVYGHEIGHRIGIFHSDDLLDILDMAVGSILYIGEYDYDGQVDLGLYGHRDLGFPYGGHFLGSKEEKLESLVEDGVFIDEPQIVAPEEYQAKPTIKKRIFSKLANFFYRHAK